MVQILHIVKWEFINRIKTKLFIFTTFVLPLLIGGMTYLPTILIDLEPENSTNVGLVYSDDISLLVKRFQKQTYTSLILKNGLPQFQFVRYNSEEEALDSVLNNSIDAYMYINSSILDTGEVSYYSRSLSNIKIYTNLRRVLNQLVVEQRMLNQNIAKDFDSLRTSGLGTNFIVNDANRELSNTLFEFVNEGFVRRISDFIGRGDGTSTIYVEIARLSF